MYICKSCKTFILTFTADAIVTPSSESLVRYSTTGALTYPEPRIRAFLLEEKSPTRFTA